MKNVTLHKNTISWVLILLLIIPICFKQIQDVDIWWHMQLGRSMLASQGVPDLATFYFSPVNGEFGDLRYTWLGDVLFFAIHWLAGDLGLQMLMILFVLGCCLLFFNLAGNAWPAWSPVILFLFVAGTYQLQTIRNALVSLPLLCLTLWLWWMVRHREKYRWLWVFPPLMLIWSFLHGSFLLGFGVMVLLFAGDFLDSMLGRNMDRPFLVRQYFQVICLSFACISIKNPLTSSVIDKFASGPSILILAAGALALLFCLALFKSKGRAWFLAKSRAIARIIIIAMLLFSAIGVFLYFKPYLTEEITIGEMDMREPSLAQETETLDFFGKIQFAFNNSFWETGTLDMASSDFLSPFQSLNEIYVWTSILLGLLTLAAFIRWRPARLSLLLPFLAVLALGLGYKRTIGYIAIVSTFCLLAMQREQVLTRLRGEKFVPAICFFALVFTWLGALSPAVSIGLWNNHHVGPGRAPYFSDSCAQLMLERYSAENTFTAISNGGWLLYRWYPKKKIYMDGFHAPHVGKTLSIYRRALLDQDPDAFFHRWQMKSAIVGLQDLKWQSVFIQSNNWYPRFMDLGMMVFEYQPKFEAEVADLEVLFSAEEFFRLPAYYRGEVANRLFELASGYILKGRIVEAQRFLDRNETLIKAIEGTASPGVEAELKRNLTIAETRYGGKNSTRIRDDYRYNEALTQGNAEDVMRYGERVLYADPKRFNVALILAQTAVNGGDFIKSQQFLSGLNLARFADTEFWHQKKSLLAATWARASQLAMAEERYLESFGCLEQAFEIDPTVIPVDRVLGEGFLLQKNMNAAGREQAAFELLKQMLRSFPREPSVFHALSWQILTYQEKLDVDLKLAEYYGQRALEYMIIANSPEIDTTYYNLAEIYFRLGDLTKTAYYEEKARETAPEQRKKLYKSRL